MTKKRLSTLLIRVNKPVHQELTQRLAEMIGQTGNVKLTFNDIIKWMLEETRSNE